MREAAFNKQNYQKWKTFEEKLDARSTHPDELANLFTEITDDLAYAKTYYPKSNTAQYLNGLAIKVHQVIYRNKKENKSRLIKFWKYEIPQAIYNARNSMRVSLAIFVLSILAGVISTLNDEDFVRYLLGDYYVNMTLENIKDGNPMGVYGNEGEMGMFLRITLNNIMVAMRAIALGILFSFGTYLILLYNGVMVGVFFTFLFKEGVLGTAMLTVWIHGSIEIASIVIASGAGIALGNSFVFPGTYTRGDAFKRGASIAGKIAAGLVPLFIVAGFLEGFVTRHYQNVWVGILSIGITLPFIVWYYIVYPAKIKNMYGEEN